WLVPISVGVSFRGRKRGYSIVFLIGRFISNFGWRNFILSCSPIRRISRRLATTLRPQRPESGC
ncbi:hypothetical protein HAX54_038286, partial [Datura stramonium]|nr:hypothetical protein [Datura stramonium]